MKWMIVGIGYEIYVKMNGVNILFNVIIVDTDILIDAGRNIQQALTCLTQYEDKSKLAISIITKMEIVVGCRDKNELRNTEKFLNRFQLLNLNKRL